MSRAVRRPVLSQNYPNSMPPMPPDGYQPITYYNDTIKQEVGVLYNPITGDVKSDGSYVSDMLASPDMTKHFGKDAQKSVEMQYADNMTPQNQRPDSMGVGYRPNMRADALDMPMTSNSNQGILNESSPALMTEDEAFGILQNPEASEESRLNARKTLSPNFKEPVLSEIVSKYGEEDAIGTLQNPNADPVELNKAREYFSGGQRDLVGSGRGNYGMPAPALDELSATDSAVLPSQGEMPTDARKDPYMAIPSTKDGYHIMPDGTLMADSEMEADGVLGNNGKAPSVNKGVLNTDTTSSNDRKGSVVSANARGSMMPFAKINRNEALMRIGGAMVGGSSQGFSGAMKAATDEFGNIQDANRKAETDAFNKAEATRLAEARIQVQKDKADKNKKAMGMPSAVYKQAALTAITDIKGRLANESGFNPFDNNTGLFGYAMSHVAGTDAHDTANAIDTIEASIGFDRLQKMRDDSPTGGALGQVSNIELALLRKSLGSLKQSSSRAQFIKNLNSIETQYKKAVAAVEAQQREWYRMQGVDVPEPVNNSAEPAVVGGYSIVTKQK